MVRTPQKEQRAREVEEKWLASRMQRCLLTSGNPNSSDSPDVESHFLGSASSESRHPVTKERKKKKTQRKRNEKPAFLHSNRLIIVSSPHVVALLKTKDEFTAFLLVAVDNIISMTAMPRPPLGPALPKVMLCNVCRD